MARRVEVGAVEERVGLVRGLDAVVAGRAGVRVDVAAVEHGERLVELGPGAESTRSPVTTTASGPSRLTRAHRSRRAPAC